MEGTTEPDSSLGNGCTFEWDEKSQLYYHASTGFYHDPAAGWYYSSRDGLYYKFENGNYVQLDFDQGANSDPDKSVQGDTVALVHSLEDEAYSSQGGESEAYELLIRGDELSTVQRECDSSQMPEQVPPPSEWLEETLIDLYLSNYPNQAADEVNQVRMLTETDHEDNLGKDDIYELEEGEWIMDEDHGPTNSSGIVLEEGASWEEENWHAQFGQVIHSEEQSVPDFQVINLWDWAAAAGTRKDGKSQVVRLVGRLLRQSARLHPSVHSGGGLLKTAPICEVDLDLVRVTTGQLYKLKSPSAKYLASLSTYDSSNPTKDWGFPKLSINRQAPSSSSGKCESNMIKGVPIHEDLPYLPCRTKASKDEGGSVYRDRAAERRALHGGFGVGPGQKTSAVDESVPLSQVPPEEAAGEALDMSFGAGSYARRILENMGWKEGEGLGSSSKGLKEPLQAVGNKGNAGLGWNQNRKF